jgi:hypothetical protein
MVAPDGWWTDLLRSLRARDGRVAAGLEEKSSNTDDEMFGQVRGARFDEREEEGDDWDLDTAGGLA